MCSRLVVLVSGAGTLLQALLDACARDGFGARVVAVGADGDGAAGLARARAAGVPAFVCRVADHASRDDWDRALTECCTGYSPDLIISAGFGRLLGPAFLAEFGGRCVNSHPALLPSFPGLHAVRDALDHGVKVTGCTLFMVDGGTDTGPIIAQAAVPVLDGDGEEALHERIKQAERELLVRTVAAMVAGGWSVRGRAVTIGSRRAGAGRNRR